jgi:hypothetical protein
MNKEELAQNLDEALGEKSVRVIMPKQFLVSLENTPSKQNDQIAKNLDNKKVLNELVQENIKTRELLVELKKAIVENKIDRVEVSNFPKQKDIKFPEPIKIPEYPKIIEIKKPIWYEKFTPRPIVEVVEKGVEFLRKSFAQDLEEHEKVEKAIAVRLVSADGKMFYNAAFANYGGGGGGTSSISNWPSSIVGPGAPTIDSFTSAAVNLAANTANQSIIAAPGANKQIWIYGLFGTANVAGSISIQDEDDTAISGVMPVGITGGWVIPMSGNFSMPWKKVATNKAVEIDTVTCEFDGLVAYAIVSV